VKGTSESWINRIGSWKFPTRAAFLSALYAVYLLVISPIAWLLDGVAGLTALGFATFVCFVAGLLALVATPGMVPADRPAVHAVLGMGLRMSLPLVVCLMVTQREPGMVDAGFAWYLVGAFMIGLLIETAMSLGQLTTK